MPRIIFHGPARHGLPSYTALMRIGLATTLRHLCGRRLLPAWGVSEETGVRFWRRQFTRALEMGDMAAGRQLFDSLETRTDEVLDVRHAALPGTRLVLPAGPPRHTLLYLHGGGYALRGRITYRFADLLAHRFAARVVMPEYPLTPEHPHPAQRDAALAAYRALLDEGLPPGRITLIGDSAGGHLALMTLVALRDAGLPQPGLCIGLCPWTDIGPRGASLTGNDRYDLVQGWMALRFGEWLRAGTGLSREALSPIHQDYRGLAPIYLQGGGREVLIDMIRDFAGTVARQGAEVLLDVWPDRAHDFHYSGTTHPDSAEALDRIAALLPDDGRLAGGPRTETGALLRRRA